MDRSRTNAATGKRKRIRSTTAVVMALVLAVVVSVSSIETSSYIASRRIRILADSQAQLHASILKTVTVSLFSSTDWLIYGFLTSFADVIQYDDDIEHASVTIPDSTLMTLDKQFLFRAAQSFMDYNNDLLSTVMIFEPGVIRDAGTDGFAYRFTTGSGAPVNLLESGYDIYASRLYRTVADSIHLMVVSDKITDNEVWTTTFAVPVRDSRNRLIGQLWVDADPDNISRILSEYQSQNDVLALLLDKDCNVISASDNTMNGKGLKDAISGFSEIPVSDGWFASIQNITESGKADVLHGHGRLDSYSTYIFPIQSTPYRLLVIKPDSNIYESVRSLKWVLLAIAAICFVIIVGCVLFIFMLFKRKADSNRRMAADLDTASDIQRSILPPNPRPGDLPDSVSLFGLQIPAKIVGGDLYDYILKDGRLYFCIGDVSGKGVPAALVMTQICSLFRFVVHSETNPATIMSTINRTVMERSDDSTLCTMFVAVLDLSTGHLEYCNAGHTKPVLIPACGKPEYIEVRPNMPLFGFEDWKYESESITMKPGDRLFLYTDGVPETVNDKNGFFGSDATLALIGSCTELEAPDISEHILSSLNTFANGVKQHDDITMLSVRYNSDGHDSLKPGETATLHYDSIGSDVSWIVNEVLQRCGLPDELHLRLALEEPIQNIADYAYAGASGNCKENGPLDIEIEQSDDCCQITLVDCGKPFNPLEQTEPDTDIPLEERQIGGLGIMFTRKFASDLEYSYTDGCNRLKLKYKKQ